MLNMCDNSVVQTALRDIVEDLGPEPNQKEIWTFRPSMLLNKQTTILNQQLGVHKVNKVRNTLNKRYGIKQTVQI